MRVVASSIVGGYEVVFIVGHLEVTVEAWLEVDMWMKEAIESLKSGRLEGV